MVASVSLCCFAVAVCQYSAVLFLILVAEIGSAVLLGVYKSSINKCLECSMQHQVQYSYNKTDLPHIKSDNATDLLTLAWDRMQEGVSAAVSSYMTVRMCFILWHVKETTANAVSLTEVVT